MSRQKNKQIEVQIMGQGYLLSCPEGGESALLDAVERVDTAMCRIRNAGKVKARDRIAVLASLNLAFELSQLENRLNRLTMQHAQAAASPLALMPAPPPVSAVPMLPTTPLRPAAPAASATQAALLAQARIQQLVQRLDQALGEPTPTPDHAN
ncbi:MAG: Cell division protein ZapA [Pseudomonadota bacterium]|jgi:cell division protein ZapA